MSKSESYPGCGEVRWARSRYAHICTESSCPGDQGGKGFLCPAPALGCLDVALSPHPGQAGEGSADSRRQQAKPGSLAGSSRGRLPRRGAVCGLEVRTAGMVHADYTHPCPRFCYYFVLIVGRFPGRGSKGVKVRWQKQPLPRQAVSSFAPGCCLCWWQGLGGERGQASLQTGWLTVGMAGLGDAACEVTQP